MPFYETCTDCERSMRLCTWPADTGEVVHHGRGKCRQCHAAATYRARLDGATPGTRATPPEACTSCRRPFGHRGTATAHGGNGRCIRCYHAARRGNTTARSAVQPTRRVRKRQGPRRRLADVIEDFEFLADALGARRVETKLGYTAATRQRIADRLGMKRKALDAALYRNLSRIAAETMSTQGAMLTCPASAERTPAA